MPARRVVGRRPHHESPGRRRGNPSSGTPGAAPAAPHPQRAPSATVSLPGIRSACRSRKFACDHGAFHTSSEPSGPAPPAPSRGSRPGRGAAGRPAQREVGDRVEREPGSPWAARRLPGRREVRRWGCGAPRSRRRTTGRADQRNDHQHDQLAHSVARPVRGCSRTRRPQASERPVSVSGGRPTLLRHARNTQLGGWPQRGSCGRLRLHDRQTGRVGARARVAA